MLILQELQLSLRHTSQILEIQPKAHIIIYRKIPIDYSDFAIKNYSNTFQLFYNLNQGITFWR